MPKIKPIKLVIIILCIAVIAVLAWKFFKPKQQQPQYITAEVTRGDIENNVLATGTLDATKLISVGAQVSGQVKKMYVQLGDQVKQGQLIAQIDSNTSQLSEASTDIEEGAAALAASESLLVDASLLE